MVEPIFLHDHSEFEDLLRIVAENEGIDPVIVEKDYWIMHVLWGLKNQQLDFALKGGTSLSKGYNLINRFSEDIDILIQPPAGYPGEVNPKSDKPNAVQSRKAFYDWLATYISIPGISQVTRDHEFDDVRQYRSGGIRLYYPTFFGSLKGVKDGILLEAGFSQVAPNEGRFISSWAYDHASKTIEIPLIDNRAKDILCYHPGYTFIEKIQTIIRHYRQETTDGTKKRNFMRQYNDIYSLLADPNVVKFLGSPEYEQHKSIWIRGADAEIPVNKHPAFLLENPDLVADFTARYKVTSSLYFRGQVPFADIIAKIQAHLDRM